MRTLSLVAALMFGGSFVASPAALGAVAHAKPAHAKPAVAAKHVTKKKHTHHAAKPAVKHAKPKHKKKK